MEDSRRKLFRKKGYKPFWEDKDEETQPAAEPLVKAQEEEDEKFKLIKGLFKKGLGSVIKKK